MTTASKKTRILFVDDEEPVLRLLQRTVAGMDAGWETVGATSGDAALALMEQQPFEIVVSDMRMPGMTGGQLLNEILRRHPGTVRIMMSGYADEEQVLKCVGATHQYLAKPFDLAAFKVRLLRIRSLKACLPSAEIQELLAQRGPLPSIPSVYHQMLEALQSPDCPTQRLGEIVATDPALTAKLLQLVNSAYFGTARTVASAEEAVMILGVGIIRALALSVHVFSAFDRVAIPDWSVDQLWHHSLRVARLARKLVEVEGAGDELWEQAFTAGVLHDIGQLLLADSLPERYLTVHRRALQEGRPLVEMEREAFGVTHAEAGAYLLDLWGLPTELVEAVAFHHAPGQTPEPRFSSLTAVHVANALDQAGADATRLPLLLDSHYLDQLGLHARFDVWRTSLSAL